MPVAKEEAPEAPENGGSSGDEAERLKKLQRLYDDGLINDQEYRQQRAKILRGL